MRPLGHAAESADVNVSGRAVWGLGHGVAPQAQTAAADVLVAVLELRTDPSTFPSCLRGLSAYGSRAHAARLQALLDGPSLDAERRTAIERTLIAIQARTK